MCHSIPWARPVLWGKEQEYLLDALASTWISGGPYLERLEREIGACLGVPTALAVANGTVAIHLAYLGIGLTAGDEVVVPGFGFLAAANVALHLGARPVFAEVDPDSWCLNAEAVERVLSPRTKAVVPVHTYGNVCDMDPILDLCARRGIAVIEDAAESFGSCYKGRQSGSLGDIGCYSFQATKTITTGEGGLVVTRRDELVEPLRLYRSHGMLRRRYLHEVAGLNFRLTNLQAALGCAQFERMDAIIEARRQMIGAYRRCLSGFDGTVLQAFAPDVDPVVWAVGVRLERAAFPQGRDAVMARMAEAGIETRPGFYAPTAMKPLYPEPIEVPGCEAISRQVISLPSYPTLTDSEIEFICTCLKTMRT